MSKYGPTTKLIILRRSPKTSLWDSCGQIYIQILYTERINKNIRARCLSIKKKKILVSSPVSECENSFSESSFSSGECESGAERDGQGVKKFCQTLAGNVEHYFTFCIKPTHSDYDPFTLLLSFWIHTSPRCCLNKKKSRLLIFWRVRCSRNIWKISGTMSSCQLVPAVQFPAAKPLLRYWCSRRCPVEPAPQLLVLQRWPPLLHLEPAHQLMLLQRCPLPPLAAVQGRRLRDPVQTWSNVPALLFLNACSSSVFQDSGETIWTSWTEQFWRHVPQRYRESLYALRVLHLKSYDLYWIFFTSCSYSLILIRNLMVGFADPGPYQNVTDSQYYSEIRYAVFHIHDILVWIQICGTMPLTNGSRCWSGSCYFRHWPLRHQQKPRGKKIFLLITVWIKVFLTIFALW